jgi:hypothetical protein
MYVGHRGQPFASQLLEKHRAIDAGLPLPQIGTISGVRHATASAIRLQKRIKRTNGAGHEPRQRGEIVQAILIDQHFPVRSGKTEPALSRFGLLVIDLEDARHCLLFEPLAGVPFGCSGS